MKIFKLISIFWWLQLNVWAMEHLDFPKVLSLEDIKHYTKIELREIKSHYGEYSNNKELFSQEQFALINRKNLTPIIAQLILHKNIKINNCQQLIEYATDISDSGIAFLKLEPRIKKHIENGDLIFTALRYAIEREKFHQWKVKRNQEVRDKNGSFIKTISELSLTDVDRVTVINAYAVCIDSFTFLEGRKKMQPIVCEPIDEYKEPHHDNAPLARETPATHESPRVLGYRKLVAKAKEVAKAKKLNVFEKAMMAKCISEQSLRFFSPARYPFRAFIKTCEVGTKSPEEAFFMGSGVCGNFSHIAYNIANAIGLKNQIFLAKNGFHTYLEFKPKKLWYHIHPSNNISKCDITRFSAVK